MRTNKNQPAKMLPLILSILLGIIFTLIPLPPVWDDFRPEWVGMLILYWTLYSPKSFGIISAWIVGLVVDVLTGSLLGQHALGYILLSYMALSVTQQYPMFSVLQQLIVIFISMSVYLAAMMWIVALSGTAPDASNLWYPIFLTVLLWHWMSTLLNRFVNR